MRELRSPEEGCPEEGRGLEGNIEGTTVLMETPYFPVYKTAPGPPRSRQIVP